MPMQYVTLERVPVSFGQQLAGLWFRAVRPEGTPWPAPCGQGRQVARSLPALQVLQVLQVLQKVPVPE